MPKLKTLVGPSRLKEFQVALDACDVVGNWSWDAGTDHVRSDTFVALVFNVDPEEAEAGLPLSAYAAGIHPTDRTRVLTAFRNRSPDSGPAVVEYRVCSADGIVRWVLSRGRYSYDSVGRPLRAHGIIVDITDLQARDGDEAFGDQAEEPVQTPLDQAAAAAITAFQAIVPLNDPGLTARVEALLFEIGRKLATQEANEARTRLN
ncbi:PAS fold-containing protein [Methylobacterium phyllostachyos]|uniref:PAS fold-containing protein n=1 Tax=Methylobacterium phyllostachyos TaxID=582672 RepID=A0A1G9Z4C7_9HYPH|nr:PAS domain-containing protein [Methylobacterium phyllostachyos]SDN16134.1 PAS fold-containing protein [Methylobacterium phyllostachyos]